MGNLILEDCRKVSIPQAVSTVATQEEEWQFVLRSCFNTASGKYCCNPLNRVKEYDLVIGEVSIPQAVSTVATRRIYFTDNDRDGFNTASGKYCCNSGS